MIVLVNPRATRPKNRRFPLSVMAIGASLPQGESWEIVDGNRPSVDPFEEVVALVERGERAGDAVRAIALTVMPGPQLVSAVPLTKRIKERFPRIPTIWGGYFGSLYPTAVLNAPYVDWMVKGPGDQTFTDLLEVIDGRRDPKTVAGLCFRDAGSHQVGRERPWLGPDELPSPPYHKIPVDDYLHPTYLGRRSGVYQASIGCPYGCKFCGVISVYGSREKLQAPERTARDLAWLAEKHGMDSVHFYDNNFFVKEDHALELCERIAPLDLAWWCEARIDALLRFSDPTWRAIKRAGLKMVFLGAESGSDEVLARMNKRLTTAETVEIARRAKEHGIIPEFSFVLGDPENAEGEIENTLAFIRKLKGINPAMEVILYLYTPTPQRRGTYGNVDATSVTPTTLEEWTRPEWVGWMTHEDPLVPWLPRRVKAKIDDFEVVLRSRFPSVQDTKTRGWGKALAKVLAAPRWSTGRYENPWLLRAVKRWARIPAEDSQAYGHLRPAAEGAA